MKVSVIYHGKKKKVRDKEYLLYLAEYYLNLSKNRLLNQAAPDSIIRGFGKDGLQIGITYPHEKMVSISGFGDNVNVEKVFILDDHNAQWLVMCTKNGRMVFYLKQLEIDEIYKCVDIRNEEKL